MSFPLRPYLCNENSENYVLYKQTLACLNYYNQADLSPKWKVSNLVAQREHNMTYNDNLQSLHIFRNVTPFVINVYIR